MKTWITDSGYRIIRVVSGSSNTFILHTPGHSPGSVSMIVDNGLAIVGDWHLFHKMSILTQLTKQFGLKLLFLPARS